MDTRDRDRLTSIYKRDMYASRYIYVRVYARIHENEMQQLIRNGAVTIIIPQSMSASHSALLHSEDVKLKSVFEIPSREKSTSKRRDLREKKRRGTKCCFLEEQMPALNVI